MVPSMMFLILQLRRWDLYAKEEPFYQALQHLVLVLGAFLGFQLTPQD